MILQCDQCNTKFRLDDSKLKPGGVKVRCSKCRHVFLAGAEQSHEESEFDAILSGLGAPAPEKGPEAAPAGLETGTAFGSEDMPAAERGTHGAAEQLGSNFAEFEFGDEPDEPPQQPAVEEQESSPVQSFDFGEVSFKTGPVVGIEQSAPAPGIDFGEFEFNEEPAVKTKESSPALDNLDFGDLTFAEEGAVKDEKTAPAAAGALDFDDFSFDEVSAPTDEKPVPAAAEGGDFGEFSFEEEGAQKDETPTPDAAGELDFGEFSFDEEIPPTDEKPAVAAAGGDDFGEFSFEEESVQKDETSAPDAAVGFDFGNFSFDEVSAPIDEKPAPAAAVGFDFGDFSSKEESVPKNEQAAPAAIEATGFGEFSFGEESFPADEKPVPAADALDFGDFSFEEDKTPKGAEPSPAEPDFGDFSFEEESVIKEAPASDDFDALAVSDQQRDKQEPAASKPDEEFDFGEFTFSDDSAPKRAPHMAEAIMPAGTGVAGSAVEPVLPAGGEKTASQERPLDLNLGAEPFTIPDPEEVPDPEDLPPLSISSRRKGRSMLTASIVAISVIVVVALSGAGLYLLQSGPAAMEKFDKLGIGFVAQWFGMESPEDGGIAVRNPVASFHQNQQAGELFVVTGDAVNSYRKARASIQVKVSIFDKGGKVLLQETAYCGNRLTDEQLTTLPMDKIEAIMNNQFGDSLSNLDVKPGQPIAFVVALANVPKEAADFGVEVVGSTVAGQQN